SARAEVREDLGLARERMRPVGVFRERERVEVRVHVARATRIRVVSPHAADVAGALEHEEIVDARLEEAYRRAESAEACTDDGDAQMRRAHAADGDAKPSAAQEDRWIRSCCCFRRAAAEAAAPSAASRASRSAQASARS